MYNESCKNNTLEETINQIPKFPKFHTDYINYESHKNRFFIKSRKSNKARTEIEDNKIK